MSPRTRTTSPSKKIYLRIYSSSLLVVCAAFAQLVMGCGGGSSGGGGGGGGGGNTGTYTIVLSTNAITLTAASPQNLAVTLSSTGGLDGKVPISLVGLPVGVTATPATFTLGVGDSQTIQLSVSSSAAYSSSTIFVTGSTASSSFDAQLTLTVQTGPPSVSVSLKPASITLFPGTTQTVAVQIGATNGYTGTVNGTVTGLPAGITVSQSTFSNYVVNNQFNLVFTAASSATTSGTATIAISGAGVSASANLPISVSTAPAFTISSGIFTALAVVQSSSSTFTVTATDYNGFNQPVAVSFSGIPSGITFSPATFIMQPGVPQVVTVSSTFVPPANSTYNISITGVGGGITQQAQFTLLVLGAELNLSVQPTALTVAAGSTGTFEMQILGTNGGTGNINVQISSPPSGVKLAQSNFTIPAGGAGLTGFVEASPTAVGGNLTITATYGPLTQNAQLQIIIGPAESITPVALSTADQMVRTDAITPYTGFPPPNYLIYHAATNRFFSTDGNLSQLNVVEAASRQLTNTLMIPGAFGLDQAPDGSVLYVGTMVGDLYVVDPVGLTVLKRYPSNAISPYGFAANAVYALADGKLLLEQYFLVPGFSYVDGNGPLAVWDPQTNAISVLQGVGGSGTEPITPTCLPGFQNAILTNNRTRVLLSPVQTAEGSSFLCSLDPEAGTWNFSQVISGGQESALATFALTSDGNTLVAYDGYDIYTLDAATLAVKSSFAVPTTQGLVNYPIMFLSQDNTKVYMTDGAGADVMDVYDLATGKLTGWIPELVLSAPGSYSGIGPIYQAMTASGLAAGVIEGGGIGLLDTTAVHALPIGSRFSQTQLDVPFGPAGGGTATTWLQDEVGVAVAPLGSVYFGSNAATGLDNDTFDAMLAAVSPAGNAGPVDVRTFATDGGSQFLPYGFSYGPWVREAATNYATAEGGGPGSLFGIGFGLPAYNGSQSTYIPPPPDLQVTVGGSSATVLGYNPDPSIGTYFVAPPLPYNTALYTVPPGVAGTSAAITVTNSSGSTTASSQITYLPALQQYPVAGQLVDGIYDPKRDVYYFTDSTQVRVFSLTQGAWLASIPIPAPQNAYGPQRLYGLGLSPDGSKLAISDPGAIAIYIVNPDQPSSIQSFPFAAQIGYYAASEEPSGVAITNNGTVYFATFDLDGDGGSGYLYSLNSSTGIVSMVNGQSGDPYLPTEGDDPDGRLAITADGSRVYFNDDGELGWVDTASGYFVAPDVNGSILGNGSYELVLCANQVRLFTDGLFNDSNLEAFGVQTLNVAESVDADYLYGAALSADGTLLFQPADQAIDVFDGNTGSFRARVSLPVPLSPNFRALVSNNRDSRLVAITGSNGNGIAVIDLNSIPEPAPLTYQADAVSAHLPTSHRRITPSAIAGAVKARNAFSVVPGIHRRRSPLFPSLSHAQSMVQAPAQTREQSLSTALETKH